MCPDIMLRPFVQHLCGRSLLLSNMGTHSLSRVGPWVGTLMAALGANMEPQWGIRRIATRYPTPLSFAG